MKEKLIPMSVSVTPKMQDDMQYTAMCLGLSRSEFLVRLYEMYIQSVKEKKEREKDIETVEDIKRRIAKQPPEPLAEDEDEEEEEIELPTAKQKRQKEPKKQYGVTSTLEEYDALSRAAEEADQTKTEYLLDCWKKYEAGQLQIVIKRLGRSPGSRQWMFNGTEKQMDEIDVVADSLNLNRSRFLAALFDASMLNTTKGGSDEPKSQKEHSEQSHISYL